MRWVPLVVALLLLPVAGGPERPDVRAGVSVPTSVMEPAKEGPAVRALSVLRRWDRSRAAAYASGQPGALRRLYGPGSWAGARDARRLREYAERGLVVRGLQMQLLEVDVLPAARGSLRVRVLDRFAGGVVVRGRSEVTLPAGRPRSRVLTFDDVGRRWVLRSVRPG